MKSTIREMAFRMMALAVIAAMTVVAVAGAASAATSAVSLSSKDSDKSETGIGSLIADAIRAQVKADIALVSASELKDVTIPAGGVSASDIAKAVTYQNDTVVVLTLRGEQVRSALERSVTIYPQKNLGFLQVSGLTFTFDPARSKESRVVSAQVGGRPLEDAREYRVAASNSLANGALGYFRVWSKDQITSVTKDTIVQAVDELLSSRPRLDYAALNRITTAK